MLSKVKVTINRFWYEYVWLRIPVAMSDSIFLLHVMFLLMEFIIFHENIHNIHSIVDMRARYGMYFMFLVWSMYYVVVFSFAILVMLDLTVIGPVHIILKIME